MGLTFVVLIGNGQKVGLSINNTAVASARNIYRSNMCVGAFNITADQKAAGEALLSYYKAQFGE